MLIDEIDALAPSRDLATQSHEISLISQFLVLLDGLETRGCVQVIATTNRLEAIDAAVRRCGRFDYHIEVPLPEEDGREEILARHLARLRSSPGIDLGAIAQATEGFSGAELAALTREAGLRAIQRGLSSGSAPASVAVRAADLHLALEALSRKRA